MFWSPAVTTLSVAACCAATGRLRASAASAANKTVVRCMTASRGLANVLSRIEMQRRSGQGDADRLADREPTRVVHQILVRSDADRIAVKASGIRGVGDPSAQYQAAVRGLTGWTKPCLLAAEVSYGSGAERDLRSAAGCDSLENHATIERAFGDNDLPFGT